MRYHTDTLIVQFVLGALLFLICGYTGWAVISGDYLFRAETSSHGTVSPWWYWAIGLIVGGCAMTIATVRMMRQIGDSPFKNKSSQAPEESEKVQRR